MSITPLLRGLLGPLLTSVALAQPVAPIDEANAQLAYERNTIEVVRAIGGSVVAVNVSVRGEAMLPFENVPPDEVPEQFRDLLPFLRESTPTRQSAGSGFVIDVDGARRLVTNFHVVQAALEPGSVRPLAGASITVAFPDGPKAIPVEVIGVNPSFDLALLQPLDAGALPPVPPIVIADSDAVEAGQKAIAIGNPFGFASTVTSGIVSAVGRLVPSIGMIEVPMIQTDAAINPGNSGGPLLDSRGELIGVNTSIFNPGGRSFAGLGFAVPSNLLRESLANLELGGLTDIRDTRPNLGATVRSVGLLPNGLRELLELPAQGVVILEVAEGGPAARAGLRGSQRTVMAGNAELPAGGDVIVAVDGMEVTDAEQLNRAVTYDSSFGDRIAVTVLRDGVELTVTVALEGGRR
jgi:S1-C subfamily serine protease